MSLKPERPSRVLSGLEMRLGRNPEGPSTQELVRGFRVLEIIVQFRGTYMIVRYLDPSGKCGALNLSLNRVLLRALMGGLMKTSR